jgi:hypothetical protein
MIRPSPATQPWPESVNWTAARAWAPWPEPDGVVAMAAAPLAAQDAAGAGDAAVPDELAELGVEPVPTDALVPAGVVDPAPADPDDDAAAQPAAEPATASTVSADPATRRTRGANV